MEWKDYIAADPEVLAGKPVIKGTRVSVELILNRLADGWTREDLLEAYPRVSPDALKAAFAFATARGQAEAGIIESPTSDRPSTEFP